MAMATEEEVRESLRQIVDPEIGINIVDLGLIYETNIDDQGLVAITMTLTSPGCPLSGYIGTAVESAVTDLEGVKDVDVDIVWSPPWNPSMMSEDAKLELGIM
ncbi:MAG TPA: metal-sulfur cluster assembly factor [Chloroflexota bacterium]|nr:metal-sulfur cluster assembly factor [Chloroflexota bacterium]